MTVTVGAQDLGRVSTPPEPRIPVPQFSFPEHALTKQIRDAEAFAALIPVRDTAGNTRFLIDLTDDAAQEYSLVPPSDGMPAYHKPNVRNLVQAFAAKYQFTPIGMTSWIGNSVVAYLSTEQAKAIELDPLVTGIHAVRRIKMSGALWADYRGPNSQWVSWGTQAIGGYRFAPLNGTTVYVLDAGVGFHSDLPTVLDRSLVDPFTYYSVGCYPHATAVAGVISAYNTTIDSLVGTVPQTKLVSLSVSAVPNPQGAQCASYVNLDLFRTGLDRIYNMVATEGKVGVVNISANDVAFKSLGWIGSRFPRITTPTGTYPGALIVMSAGNQQQDACAIAYDVASPADGVIVVGGYDASGQQVGRLNGMNGFRNPSGVESQPGSNFGACVELWGPSKDVYVTWASDPQLQSTTYTTHARLSGTSFAAPHVTALAAWVESSWGPVSPQALEGALRSYAHDLWSDDDTGRAVSLVWTPNLPPTTVRALPSPEFLLDGEVNGVKTFTSTHQFTLRYDTRGAASCNLGGYINGNLWYFIPNFTPSYDWGVSQLGPGDYYWLIDCVSPHGSHNYADARAIVVPPPPQPTVSWYIDGIAANNQTMQRQSSQSFELRYDSSGADSCNLIAEKGPYPGSLGPWYSVSPMLTAYNWGIISLPPYQYKWTVTCSGAGGTAAAFVHMIVPY